MKPGTVILEIDRIVAGGFGLARTDDGTVLVRGALPGERVTARPQRSGGVLRAHAMEILEPHPARVDIALPPGADLPLAYEAQLPLKQALVVEALSRIAKLDADVQPIAPSPRELGYRTSAQYAVHDGGLGAHALGSDRIVPLERDALVAEPIAEAFATAVQRPLHGIDQVTFRASLHEGRALAGLIGSRAASGERLARALTDSDVAGVVWSETDDRGRFRGRSKVLAGADRLLEDFGGVLATVSIQGFAQVNPRAAGALYLEAATLAGTGARAVELYAGSGVLGMHISRSFEEVVAVEISPDSVRAGEADARRLRAPVRFERGDARVVRKLLPADLVAMDPPRAGVEADVIRAIAAGSPATVVYVSCDPTTWARDVAALVDVGYRLEFVRPYDFYPFTHHVEVLSVLRR